MDETTTSTLAGPILAPEDISASIVTAGFSEPSEPVENGTVAVSSSVRFSLKRAYAQTFAATVAVRLLGAASGILAARLLGPAGRGELAIITLLPMTLLPLGELELPRALAYEVSKLGKAPSRIISSGLWLGFGLGCLQMFVLVGVLGLFLPADKSYLLSASRWFTVYLPLVFLLTCVSGIDQGRGRFGRFSILQAIPGLIYVLVILIGWLAHYVSPQLLAVGLVLGVVLPAVVRVATEFREVQSSRPDLITTRTLLLRGLSFYLPALAALALTRADTFLLVRLVPIKEIGLYIVAQAIAVGQIGSINPFVQVGFTDVAGASMREDALYRLAHQFRLAQLAAVSAAILTGLAVPWIIQFAFGPTFVGATITGYILIFAAMFGGASQILDQGLRAAGHTTAGAVSNLIGLVILLALGAIGCLQFGIVGLSAAVLCAYMTTAAALLLFCCVRLKMSPRLFWAFDKTTVRELARVIGGALRRFIRSNRAAYVIQEGPN